MVNRERRNYTLSKSNLELVEKLSVSANMSRSAIVDSALTEFFERQRDSLVLNDGVIKATYKFPNERT